jgi:hypothetical protein
MASRTTTAPDATIWAFPALATGAVFASAGVTTFDISELGPAPAAFVAVTEKV